MKAKLIKILKHKLKGEGAFNILVGTSIIFMFSMFMYVETIYNKNAIVANYVEDNITSSLLGSALASMEEYGASNQLIIYDMIDNHSNNPDDGYINYIDAIEFSDGTFYSSYIFEDTDQIDNLGDILETTESGNQGPEQSYEIFELLLKSNMNLNNSMAPKTAAYLPLTKDGVNPNIVEIKEFRVYNYIEFLVKDEDFDSKIVLTKPLINIDGDIVETCDYSGKPLIESYEQLKELGLIHTKIVCFDIENRTGTPIISAVESFPVNEIVYIKDSSNNTILGEDGKEVLVEASGIYSKIELYVDLGKEHLDKSNPNKYTKVSRDKIVFIERNTNKAIEG